MAQGTRGRWLRVATTGLGVVLCTGLVGCLNSDKPKDTKIGAKQQGLPGTPRLDGAGAGLMTRSGQPTNPNVGANPVGGGSVQPAGNFQPAGYPPAGAGLGAGQSQFRSNNGMNTLNTSAPQPNYGSGPASMPGGGSIGAPAVPGAYTPPVTPAGGTGASQYYGGGVTPGGGAAATPPSLVDMPLPPPPPLTGGSDFGAGTGGVPSSLGPIAPPTPPAGATGKGPPLNSNYPN